MKYVDLYTKLGKYYDSEVFFVDPDCKIPYTGPMEDYSYDGKRLESVSDIVNGLKEGMEICYYDTGEPECVYEMRDGTAWGLFFEFYKSGQISAVSLIFNTALFDLYAYDEEGRQAEEQCRLGDSHWQGIDFTSIKEIVSNLRKEYDMDLVNQEILAQGKPVTYGRALYEKAQKSKSL